jgi:hypothetical protein
MSKGKSSSGVQGVLDYGIDLKLESEEEEIYYISQMCDFFNEQTDFRAYLSGDRTFEIELDRSTLLMEVSIYDSILSIIPYTEDILEVFALILKFIATYHQSIVDEFRPTMGHRIQSPSEVTKTNKETLDEKGDEEESSEDWEWI